MLRSQKGILAQLLSPTSASALSPLHRLLPAVSPLISCPSTSPVFPLHRHLSAAAAPRISPNPSFAVDDYLVSACGLTRPQALKASATLSHLKSPAKPDAVLAFLAGLGLSGADVAALVAKDPRFLCAKVGKTLAPVVTGLTGLGLPRSDIGRLASLAGKSFRCRSVVSKLEYCLPLLGSYENLLRALKRGSNLFASDLERVVKPNVSFLQECGLGACDISQLCLLVPWLPSINPKRLRAMVACAEGIGVPRDSGMFKQALRAVAYIDKEKIAAKVEYMKNTFRWSDAEVAIAVSRSPMLLTTSKDFLRTRSEFLFSEVGLEPAYIAHRPVILTCSLVGRLRPRHYVVKFLKENGLLERDTSYSVIWKMAESVFMKKFIFPHKEAAPRLAEDYATACRGEMPTNFRFT